MCEDGGNAGRKKWTWTGDQVGIFNYTGLMNYLAGGPSSVGLSSADTVGVFIPNTLNRRPWQNADARMGDNLLDACYPNIALKWIGEIQLDANTIFRFSNQAFYVDDSEGASRFYDARAEKPPSINIDTGDWLSTNYKVSDLTLALNNRDGFYNDWLPSGPKYRQWSGAPVVIKVGFGEKYDNYFTLFEGQVSTQQGLEATRDSLNIRAYEKLTVDEVPMPARVFSSDLYPTIDNSNAGKPIPIVYGDWTDTVDIWGNVPAICTNGLETTPVLYNFKVSDMPLQAIEAAYLHRGSRTAADPLGPIRITTKSISMDLINGEFNLDVGTPMLDEPCVILNSGKCADGSGTGAITSDGTVDFVALGVKAGDYVVTQLTTAASLTEGNLRFIAKQSGTGGNAITVTLSDVLLSGSLDPTLCYCTAVGNAITITMPYSGFDSHGNKIFTSGTAWDIRKAVMANAAASALVSVKIVGTVPSGDPRYNLYSSPADVWQSEFAATHLSTTSAGEMISTIKVVSNFTLTVDNNVAFATDVAYQIVTLNYTWTSGDKVSVVCQGKPLNTLAISRLQGASNDLTSPQSLAMDYDNTYWIADDNTQAVHKIAFNTIVVQSTDPSQPNTFTQQDQIRLSIPYSTISPTMTRCTGIAIGPDGMLWVLDPDTSDGTVYRVDQTTSATVMSFAPNFSTPVRVWRGITVQPDNRVWLYEQSQGNFYLFENAASLPNAPLSVVSTFNVIPAFTIFPEGLAIAWDHAASQMCFIDRTSNTFYRLNPTTGAIVSSLPLTTVDPALSYVTGVSLAQDGTLFFLDAALLSTYNYTEDSFANVNPIYIARDILHSFGGHTYADFDLNWQVVARQLQNVRCRLAVNKATTVITYLTAMLKQFNICFFLRFGKFNAFWIDFSSFRTNGKLVTEKDISSGSFAPKKQINQYFNAAQANFQYNAFTDQSNTSNVYASSAGIQFATREILQTMDMPSIYRQQDLDTILPLFIRLAVPEPEFITVTFGFRLIRAQIHDFLTLLFSEDQVNPRNGQLVKSGRRFNNIPCMVRKLVYDLGTMTVQMSLWSLGTTQFDGYTPEGPTIGGENDRIVLSTLGRFGRISPVGSITAVGTNTLTLANADGQTAQARTGAGGLAWAPGYMVAVIDAATREKLADLTIQSVSGAVVTFVETLPGGITNTVRNAAGFAVSGHLLQYSNYKDVAQAQRDVFASFGKPDNNYPVTQTQETAEQAGGLHSFDDGGLPYVLYPVAYTGF